MRTEITKFTRAGPKINSYIISINNWLQLRETKRYGSALWLSRSSLEEIYSENAAAQNTHRFTSYSRVDSESIRFLTAPGFTWRQTDSAIAVFSPAYRTGPGFYSRIKHCVRKHTHTHIYCVCVLGLPLSASRSGPGRCSHCARWSDSSGLYSPCWFPDLRSASPRPVCSDSQLHPAVTASPGSSRTAGSERKTPRRSYCITITTSVL